MANTPYGRYTYANSTLVEGWHRDPGPEDIWAKQEIEITDSVQTYAELPAPDPGAQTADGQRRTYLVVGHRTVYRDTGSEWVAVWGLGTATNPVPGTSYYANLAISQNATVGGNTVYHAGNLSPATDAELAAHTTNTTNPHSVTAAQVGSPTTTEFNTHTANTTNPHSVTAVQAGALPTTGGSITGNVDVSGTVTAGDINAPLDGLRRQDFALNTRTFQLEAGGTGAWWKIARISDDTAFRDSRFNLTIDGTGPYGKSAHQVLRGVFGARETNTYMDTSLEGELEAPQRAHIVTTVDANNHRWLYIKATSYLSATLTVQHTARFGYFDFAKVSSDVTVTTALNGTIATDSENVANSYDFEGGDIHATETLTSDGNASVGGNAAVAGNLNVRGGITSGETATEAIPGTGSTLSFAGSATRDLHDSTVVSVTNPTTASATETVTVNYYSGVDATGTLLASEGKTVTLAAGASEPYSYLPGAIALGTGNYYIEVTTSGTGLTINGITENTRAATYTTEQSPSGDLLITDQYGRTRARYDSAGEKVTLPVAAVESPPSAATDVARKQETDSVQSNLDTHTGNTTNPHSVTAAQVGSPTTTEFNTHTGNAAAHHTRPVAGTNITEDVNSNFNVSQGPGSGLNADLLDGAESAEFRKRTQPNAHLPVSEIPAGDYAAIPIHVPTGQTLELWVWGCRTDAQTTPAGLTVELYNNTGAISVASANTAHATGAPIASIAGAADVTLRLNNGTAAPVNAGAKFGYTQR